MLTIAVARGPPLTIMQYVMYFRFCRWRHVAHNRPGKGDANKAYILSDSPEAAQGGSLISTIALLFIKQTYTDKKSSFVIYDTDCMLVS